MLKVKLSNPNLVIAMKNQSENVASPCISQCCLNDDDICVGCYRALDEITGWHSATNQRKQEILANCEKRKQLGK